MNKYTVLLLLLWIVLTFSIFWISHGVSKENNSMYNASNASTKDSLPSIFYDIQNQIIQVDSPLAELFPPEAIENPTECKLQIGQPFFRKSVFDTGQNTITISWKDAQNETGYEIYLIRDGSYASNPLTYYQMQKDPKDSNGKDALPIVSLKENTTRYIWNLNEENRLDINQKSLKDRSAYRFLIKIYGIRNNGKPCTNQIAGGRITRKDSAVLGTSQAEPPIYPWVDGRVYLVINSTEPLFLNSDIGCGLTMPGLNISGQSVNSCDTDYKPYYYTEKKDDGNYALDFDITDFTSNYKCDSWILYNSYDLIDESIPNVPYDMGECTGENHNEANLQIQNYPEVENYTIWWKISRIQDDQSPDLAPFTGEYNGRLYDNGFLLSPSEGKLFFLIKNIGNGSFSSRYLVSFITNDEEITSPEDFLRIMPTSSFRFPLYLNRNRETIESQQIAMNSNDTDNIFAFKPRNMNKIWGKYVCAFIDSYQEISESNEENNVFCAYINKLENPSFQNESLRKVNVLSLTYIPLNSEGMIDWEETGSLDSPGITDPKVLLRKIDYLNEDIVDSLEEASVYHGYTPKTAYRKIFVDYEVIDSIVKYEALPRGLRVPWSSAYRPDYMSILNDIDICRYVDDLDVKEVWMYGYHYNDIEPVESNMQMGRNVEPFWNITRANVPPYGDISNSERTNDMPICEKTYTLYNYNYGRGHATMLENHTHQLEALFRYFDSDLYNDFLGPRGAYTNKPYGCGWTHYPPNNMQYWIEGASSHEYFWNNPRPEFSDCMDWKPFSMGNVSEISCENWTCRDDEGYRFKIWWMQNLPGYRNNLPYKDSYLANFWYLITDFDSMIKRGTLVLKDPT